MSDSRSNFSVNTYLREVLQELKKVSWPSREQTVHQTVLVLLVTAIIGIYLGGLDYLLAQLIHFIVGR